MKHYSYFFDELDLNAAFVSAFDDAFVFRYDANTREAREKIAVRYVFGPKHRVLHDLNDKAKVMTLPVVTIEQMSLTRDTSRISHKNNFFYRPGGSDNKTAKVPTPIPINLELNVSIIAYYKEDIDQIVQNFVVNCNPYIIVPTQVPKAFGMPFIDELTNEVQWSGTVSYDNPKDLSSEKKWRITADTIFTVKGWMFKALDDRQSPIYTVKTDFYSSDLQSRTYTYDDYNSLSGVSVDVESIVLSAYPSFTNVFYTHGNNQVPIHSNLVINGQFQNNFLLYGKMLDRNNTFYLSSGEPNFYTNFELVSTAKHPLISAYRIPDEFVTVESDNVVRISLSAGSLDVFGQFNIVTANEAGWGLIPYGRTMFNFVSGQYLSYLQPDGESIYIQPDGESLYIHPVSVSLLIDMYS